MSLIVLYHQHYSLLSLIFLLLLITIKLLMALLLSSIMSCFLNNFSLEFHRMTFLPPPKFFHFLREHNEKRKGLCNRNPILTNDLPGFTIE